MDSALVAVYLKSMIYLTNKIISQSANNLESKLHITQNNSTHYINFTSSHYTLLFSLNIHSIITLTLKHVKYRLINYEYLEMSVLLSRNFKLSTKSALSS